MNPEPSRFVPGVYRPLKEGEQVLWFPFKGDSLLIREQGDAAQVPWMPQLSDILLQPASTLYLGAWDSCHSYAADIDPETEAPPGYRFEGLRQLWGVLEEEQFWLAGRAGHLIRWARNNQYCGRCGQPMQAKTDVQARACSCGLVRFPRISPAMITAVRRGRQLLLARSRRFPRVMYSVIAGFVEPGETLEQCVHREIAEEVGIRVHNLRYFGSQPWPFPDSLMIGFTAEYLSGDIVIDPKEIMEAGWFSPEDMPQIPDRISIARRLIDSFLESCD